MSGDEVGIAQNGVTLIGANSYVAWNGNKLNGISAQGQTIWRAPSEFNLIVDWTRVTSGETIAANTYVFYITTVAQAWNTGALATYRITSFDKGISGAPNALADLSLNLAPAIINIQAGSAYVQRVTANTLFSGTWMNIWEIYRAALA